jgi:hypothetical protein
MIPFTFFWCFGQEFDRNQQLLNKNVMILLLDMVTHSKDIYMHSTDRRILLFSRKWICYVFHLNLTSWNDPFPLLPLMLTVQEWK